MPLPTIATPTYELTIPSNGKKIKFRPFLVKEEKILILALESQDSNQISNAVKDVIKKCVLTKGIKIETLPTFDIEYIFLNIRGKSIGESIKINVTCPDDGETIVPVTIYIDEIEVKKPDNHNTDIKLDDKLTLRMKYPSFDQFIENSFETLETPEEVVDQTFKVMADCIDTIYSEDEAWDSTEYSQKERVSFIERLTSDQYKQVERFYATMPKLTHTVKVTNPNTNFEFDVTLEGLADFFA